MTAKNPSKRRRSRRQRAIILAVATLAAAYIVWGVTLNPPRPADLSHADPEVVELIDESILSLRLVPFSAERWATLGMVYEAAGMNELAAECYERSLGWGKDERIWYRLAMMRERAADLAGALEAIDSAVELEPEYGPLHWRRGFWLLADGQLDAAERAFNTAAEHYADAGWFGLARVLIQRGLAAEALDLLKESRFSRSANARYGHHLRGTAYRMIGEAELARVEFALGRGAKPAWDDPWSNAVNQYRRGLKARHDRASTLMQARRQSEAIHILRGLIEDFPDDMAIRNNLAVAYMESGKISDAVRTLKEAIELEPDSFQTHLNLASAYTQRGDTPSALKHAEKSIELNPTLSRAHETRGVVLMRMRRMDDALIALDEAARLDARNANALMFSGMILLSQEKIDEAFARFEQAVGRDAANASAWIGLTNAHITRGEIEEAKRTLMWAEMINPRHEELPATQRRLRRLLSQGSATP